MSRWSSFSTHSCNLLLSGSAPSMNNWWWPRQGFPSRTRRNRSSSHGSAFPPRISEGCSDSWPKRAPATDDLWVRKNNDRSNEGSSRWIGYWLDSRFRTVWSRLCRPLSSTRLSLLDGNPCNVSRWTRFLKVETYYYIINCYVTLFLKVFLQYFINWRFLIVWEKIGKFQNLGEDKKTNCYVQKKWKKFYFLFFSKKKRKDHYYILKWKEIDWFRNFLSIKNEKPLFLFFKEI